MISDRELREVVRRVVEASLPGGNDGGTTLPAEPATPSATPPEPASGGARRLAIGADHGGYELKERLKPFLLDLGWAIEDVGTWSEQAVDYPAIALKVADLVAAGTTAVGIVIDGAGIGSCMAANKVPGVRAALCHDTTTARNSREHNDANVLTLGGKLIGVVQAQEIVKTWLATECREERHKKRVAMITAIESRAGGAPAPR
ncbi:MAG TPA: ribose 5-phosphate isomerase B [Candidatus Eisenbacteria bacterium]